MTMMEESAIEAVVGGRVEVPADIYVGNNVERQHIAEFFYRAQTMGLLMEGENALAIFDCIILERDGGRLGGLTLHDYAVLTDQHLITWGRGLNKDIIDRFPWADVGLDKFGRRNMLEGVVKFTYLLKPAGSKHKITLRGREGHPNGETTVAETPVPGRRGTALYLDLMPAGEVKTCVEMMRYLMHRNGEVPSAAGFKERFQAKINKGIARVNNVGFLLRPFYLDMGNGMLVEAGAVAEQGGGSTLSSTQRSGPLPSPYRGVTASAAPRPAATPRPASPPMPPPPPASRPAPASTAATSEAPNYAVTGDVPNIGAGSTALNMGNRVMGAPRGGDTMRGSSGGGSKENPLGETVTLNNTPYNGPSKLDSYDGRVTGRPAASSGGQSRLTQAPAPRVAAAPRQQVAARPAPTPRPAPMPPPPRPAASRPEPMMQARSGGGSGLMPPATYVSPPPLPIAREARNYATENVLDEASREEAAALGRPLVMPIGVALPRALLNAYSISRLARGLWLDPRNLGRNITDLSQTVDMVADLADVITTDEGARNMAIRRMKRAANSTLGDNIIFHYTVWPFIKPVLDLLGLPGDMDVSSRSRRRVSVRKLDDELSEISRDEATIAAQKLPDMGPMTAQDAPGSPAPAKLKINGNGGDKVADAAKKAVDNTADAVANAADKVEEVADSLNTGSGVKDPTAGITIEPARPDSEPKSKLGENL